MSLIPCSCLDIVELLADSMSLISCSWSDILDNGVLLMYTLDGVSSVANFITAYEESQ